MCVCEHLNKILQAVYFQMVFDFPGFFFQNLEVCHSEKGVLT